MLILWGADDAWLPVDTSERLAAAIPTATRRVLAEAGHFNMLDQPHAVARALREFLS